MLSTVWPHVKVALISMALPSCYDTGRAGQQAQGGSGGGHEHADAIEEVVRLLETCPDWTVIDRGDTVTRRAIEHQLGKLSAFEPDALRAAIQTHIANHTSSRTEFSAWGTVYVLNRYYFNVPERMPFSCGGPSGWGRPVDEDGWDMLYPLSLTWGKLPAFTGGSVSYTGPKYEALEEFDSFRKAYGRRRLGWLRMRMRVTTTLISLLVLSGILGALQGVRRWGPSRRSEQRSHHPMAPSIVRTSERRRLSTGLLATALVLVTLGFYDLAFLGLIAPKFRDESTRTYGASSCFRSPDGQGWRTVLFCCHYVRPTRVNRFLYAVFYPAACLNKLALREQFGLEWMVPLQGCGGTS